MHQKLSDRFKRQFISGLVVIMPIGLTAWVIVIVFNLIGTRFLPLFEKIPSINELNVITQMLISAVLTVLVIWFIGFWARNYIGKKVMKWSESLVLKTPIVSKIYSTIRKIINNMFSDNPGFKKVGVIEYPRKGIYTVIFVTNDKITADGKEYVAVFVPSTPNPTTGYCIVLPSAEVQIIDITLNEAMEFIFSGGMIVPENMHFT